MNLINFLNDSFNLRLGCFTNRWSRIRGQNSNPKMTDARWLRVADHESEIYVNFEINRIVHLVDAHGRV